MVMTMRQSSSFLKHHTAKMLIQGRYLDMPLSILEAMLKEKISCFDEILFAVSKLIQEVQTICKLPAVNTATTAAGERSFLPQCMASEDVFPSRMDHLAVLRLNGHKQRTDSTSIADVTQEFVSHNENRKRNFGTTGNFKK